MANIAALHVTQADGCVRVFDVAGRVALRRALASAKAGDPAPLVEAVERYLGDRR